ncbi:unnamed protein product [Oppiella nova]|uniref:Uncharacterized protein n=1 Tax=Oppiella nova TaxID=334625 RepID=A0A7R9QRZ8_9ACAR|nr:unnamed protein product [Oppiella nova]CAG2172161.1 unnamed protein product [Oppiella nova]
MDFLNKVVSRLFGATMALMSPSGKAMVMGYLINKLPKSDIAADYGEAVTYDDMSAYVVDLLTPVRDLMREAEVNYKHQGLTVPIIFYEDIIRFATEKLPWCGEQLVAIQPNELRHIQVSLFMSEINGINFMARRVSRLRVGKELVITGSEQELMGRLQALDSKIIYMLTHVINNARHPFWTDFHTHIRAFLSAEFPKLYKEINALPTTELRQKNIQLLIMDLTHSLLPPL